MVRLIPRDFCDDSDSEFCSRFNGFKSIGFGEDGTTSTGTLPQTARVTATTPPTIITTIEPRPTEPPPIEPPPASQNVVASTSGNQGIVVVPLSTSSTSATAVTSPPPTTSASVDAGPTPTPTMSQEPIIIISSSSQPTVSSSSSFVAIAESLSSSSVSITFTAESLTSSSAIPLTTTTTTTSTSVSDNDIPSGSTRMSVAMIAGLTSGIFVLMLIAGLISRCLIRKSQKKPAEDDEADLMRQSESQAPISVDGSSRYGSVVKVTSAPSPPPSRASALLSKIRPRSSRKSKDSVIFITSAPPPLQSRASALLSKIRPASSRPEPHPEPPPQSRTSAPLSKIRPVSTRPEPQGEPAEQEPPMSELSVPSRATVICSSNKIRPESMPKPDDVEPAELESPILGQECSRRGSLRTVSQTSVPSRASVIFSSKIRAKSVPMPDDAGPAELESPILGQECSRRGSLRSLGSSPSTATLISPVSPYSTISPMIDSTTESLARVVIMRRVEPTSQG